MTRTLRDLRIRAAIVAAALLVAAAVLHGAVAGSATLAGGEEGVGSGGSGISAL